jgi:hypothetical protein
MGSVVTLYTAKTCGSGGIATLIHNLGTRLLIRKLGDPDSRSLLRFGEEKTLSSPQDELNHDFSVVWPTAQSLYRLH